MESNISLFEYLAYNVPGECQMILERNDIPGAQTTEDLVEGLKMYVREYKYEALDELAEIHPDRDLIEQLLEISTPYEGKKQSEFLNAAVTEAIAITKAPIPVAKIAPFNVLPVLNVL